MPLLNDAKTCYVGTQPITTIMAGSVQVWPYVHDNCDLPGRPARPEHIDIFTTPSISPKWNVAVPAYESYELEWSPGWYWTSELELNGSAVWTNLQRIEYPFLSHNLYKTNDFGSNVNERENCLIRVQFFKPSGESSCFQYAFVTETNDYCDNPDHPEELEGFSVGTFTNNSSVYACQTSSRIQPGEYWTTEIKKFDSSVWSNLQTITYNSNPNWYITYDKNLFGDNRSDRMKSEVKAIRYNASGKQSCPVFSFPIN